MGVFPIEVGKLGIPQAGPLANGVPDQCALGRSVWRPRVAEPGLLPVATRHDAAPWREHGQGDPSHPNSRDGIPPLAIPNSRALD